MHLSESSVCRDEMVGLGVMDSIAVLLPSPSAVFFFFFFCFMFVLFFYYYFFFNRIFLLLFADKIIFYFCSF